MQCQLFATQEPGQLVVAGNIIGPMPGARPAPFLTQGPFQAAHGPVASGKGEVCYFLGPSRKQPLQVAASLTAVYLDAMALCCGANLSASNFFHAHMIAPCWRAGKNWSGIFRQHGERENEFVRTPPAFTEPLTFGCEFWARAVSSAPLCRSIGCVQMLQAPQAFLETAEPDDDPSELSEGPAYAAALEARRIIEIAVFWVLGAGGLNRRYGGQPEPGLIMARHVSMYLAHVACRMSLSDVGRLYARDRTTVAYACASIEDRRDDPKFDRALELLEWAVPVMAARPAAYRLPF